MIWTCFASAHVSAFPFFHFSGTPILDRYYYLFSFEVCCRMFLVFPLCFLFLFSFYRVVLISVVVLLLNFIFVEVYGITHVCFYLVLALFGQCHSLFKNRNKMRIYAPWRIKTVFTLLSRWLKSIQFSKSFCMFCKSKSSSAVISIISATVVDFLIFFSLHAHQ